MITWCLTFQYRLLLLIFFFFNFFFLLVFLGSSSVPSVPKIIYEFPKQKTVEIINSPDVFSVTSYFDILSLFFFYLRLIIKFKFFGFSCIAFFVVVVLLFNQAVSLNLAFDGILTPGYVPMSFSSTWPRAEWTLLLITVKECRTLKRFLIWERCLHILRFAHSSRTMSLLKLHWIFLS